MAHCYLDKFANLPASPQVVEDALKFHTLPLDLQEQLATKYGCTTSSKNGNVTNKPPTTWYEALQQLKALATSTTPSSDGGEPTLDLGILWRLLLDHPMTAYVPVQCQACGHVVPDQYPLQQTDKEVGLREVPPSGKELELRAGWFRGPRKAVVLESTCTKCQHVSHWYRSGHPQIILNPHKWGRLCGEQEDWRLTLAHYLKIPVRLVVPLDWDHVWSEYQATSSTSTTAAAAASVVWQVEDESARNFCCRLDEGIGSWTRVWAIHSNPEWCQDVTQDYLTCQENGGRADDRIRHDNDNSTHAMERYAQLVQTARKDALGELTQAKTIHGHVLERANLSDEEITRELQQVTRDYGKQKWWELHQ